MPEQPIAGGYVLMARSLKDSSVAHVSPCAREVFFYLFREANWSDAKYAGFIVKRGQLFRSYYEIRQDLHWKVGYRKKTYSENQMKHSMKALMNAGMITLTKQPRGNLITVINYERFQNPENYESTSERSINQPANDPLINQSSLAINKKNKNIKNKKKETPLTPQSITTPIAQMFYEIRGFKSMAEPEDDLVAETKLLQEFTEDQIRYMLTYCSKEKYAPRIGSIQKLYERRGDIVAGLKTLQNQLTPNKTLFIS